jgi:hypothetical protein
MVYIFFEPFCKQKPSAGILPFGTDSASAQRAADSSRAKLNFLKKSTEKESPFGSPFFKEKPAKTIFREHLKISSKTTGKPTPKSPLRAPPPRCPPLEKGAWGIQNQVPGHGLRSASWKAEAGRQKTEAGSWK